MCTCTMLAGSHPSTIPTSSPLSSTVLMAFTPLQAPHKVSVPFLVLPLFSDGSIGLALIAIFMSHYQQPPHPFITHPLTPHSYPHPLTPHPCPSHDLKGPHSIILPCRNNNDNPENNVACSLLTHTSSSLTPHSLSSLLTPSSFTPHPITSNLFNSHFHTSHPSPLP